MQRLHYWIYSLPNSKNLQTIQNAHCNYEVHGWVAVVDTDIRFCDAFGYTFKACPNALSVLNNFLPV